jgi:hypothetical protein
LDYCFGKIEYNIQLQQIIKLKKVVGNIILPPEEEMENGIFSELLTAIWKNDGTLFKCPERNYRMWRMFNK